MRFPYLVRRQLTFSAVVSVCLVQKSGPLWTSLHQMSIRSESESCSVVSDSLQPHGLYSRLCIGVGSLSFLQGIFPTQGSNPGLPQCRQILHQLSYQGSPVLIKDKTKQMALDFAMGRFPAESKAEGVWASSPQYPPSKRVCPQHQAAINSKGDCGLAPEHGSP